ncbi:MAG: leucine--tRNA ligase [Spirochaetes bacterium GWF1_51_8]|nr:MAG: leucine--tRNA ligase [Spirochaetes bacterium GWF1_51_8]
MSRDYDFSAIEKKWRDYWEKNKTFKTVENPSVPEEKRFYCLDMFPYPSGAGLHVGHPEGYTATDIICRYLRMKGYNVLHPMGFDSFGLPAENYAIKTGTHPRESTHANIDNFRRQLKSLGFSYDWDREVSTCEPDYYKWTQWIFLQLFKGGLAYEANVPINWCNSCKTGLANEEVVNGRCDRCGEPVVKKDMRQWMLRITAYADRLMEDMEPLDWPESIKHLQRNWIGRSEGAEVDFQVKSTGDMLKIFTTRPDTLFGATYMVLAPEHPLVEKIMSKDERASVEEYILKTKMKSDLERTDLNKEKTGVFTGAFAVNPVNSKEIPIWISDYVLISYGTGAIMAVPAHDQRDFEFATKFGLDIIQVLSPDGKPLDKLDAAFEIDGIAINSGEFTGMKTADFKKKITEWLEKKGIGKLAVNYKLRDWVFSRQRFWGEPIPLIHCEKCGTVPVPESELPLVLPDVKTYLPTGTGESPLAAITEWVNVKCPECGGPAKRETNTMPQWAGSCWYYLRYLDPLNMKEFASKEKQKYWMPVDLYVGGAEHAVLHLLYSRFWHKFLFDEGIVDTKEPFMKLRNPGIILGEDGQKMSKSRGNVINPDDIITSFGADTMRMYEMFMGPLDVMKPWSTNGLKGLFKFLEKVWRLFTSSTITSTPAPDDVLRLTHKTIKKVETDIDSLNNFNTAISQMMILVNELTRLKEQNRDILSVLARILAPYAPHFCEEIWEILGNPPSISSAEWPKYDPALVVDETYLMIVQVNGKLRESIDVERGTDIETMKALALKSPKILKWIGNAEIVKVIAVPDKLINIVIKQ